MSVSDWFQQYMGTCLRNVPDVMLQPIAHRYVPDTVVQPIAHRHAPDTMVQPIAHRHVPGVMFATLPHLTRCVLCIDHVYEHLIIGTIYEAVES
jgi:hypothetical protein